ncbi:E3 ubiquitin-protein ligase HUWE1 isoform X2 [Cylas formicarius]|uniref:E3 ubiquitin-protein ligase HUWE1 isoform X2 n=1 Tax=Cylas formicarius TaxID=197179 RepID=UPI0029583571|nr:E3 ubiquitin-protein ligase HUWE1 isoform X2 [Cylas formicarius]
MKIDRSRVRKSTSEVPTECQQLIDKLQQCSRTELLDELSKINSWTFGKCELLHWAQVLDVFDRILGMAAEKSEDNQWALKCDSTTDEKDKLLLVFILRFTSLLIEHSFSRHLYNSMEHLLVLLTSNDMNVVLEVLNLLYMFSKRSNFITRLKTDEKECLLSRLQHLAENWGGKENGFGLAECCEPNRDIPASATTLHVEFHKEDDVKSPNKEAPDLKQSKPNLHIIHIEHIDKLNKTPAEIMKSLVSMYYVPPEKEMWLFTHVRLATHFANYEKRLKCVQARLQALSVLVYSNAIQDSPSNLLYNGILEELVEVVELQDIQLTDIRCAALRTLTAIIHLDRNPQFPNRRSVSRLNSIIDVTGASQYHGFLPVLVRNCISSLTSQADYGQQAFKKMKLHDESFPTFEESSNDSVMTNESSSLLETDSNSSQSTVFNMEFDVEKKVAQPQPQPVLVESRFPVSLTTALFSFLYHLASYDSGGEALVSCGMMESLLQVINWQGYELDHITFVTRAVRVIDLITNIDMQAFQVHGGLQSFISRLDVEVNFCKKDQLYQIKSVTSDHHIDETSPGTSTEEMSTVELEYAPDNVGKTCLPQRAALLKSMLNFLKKAFQDSTFAESIRHLMEGTLPSSLKNIIANAEYYGPSLFLLATDVVTVYVYQEPALLSALQDNGLTNVVLHSLLVKEVPATREVLGSLPNVFSALCLNNRGLESFAKHNPFEKLFHILLSPTYLPAMRRRRSSEPTADTACNLGNAMDELMRHQPSLREDATLAIINLLEELVHMGTDPKYICWRPHSKTEVSPSNSSRAQSTAEGSSDEEDDDEEETSTSSQNAQNETNQTEGNSERQPIALIDYILNAMKFIDAILSNNSTDDHCREFVVKGGLKPLMSILGLPNLPVDCPVTNPAQAVATVCKSILNLAHEPFLFHEGLYQLKKVLENLKPLYTRQDVPGGSKLLLELANAPDIETAFSTASATPILHAMGAAHGYVIMFVHICRTGQTEIRSLSLQSWGTDEGIKVLKGLADLYTSLVWESTLLLAYCSEDLIPSQCDFTKEDIEKLNQFFDKCETTQATESASTHMAPSMDVLSASHPVIPMDVDVSESTVTKPDNRNLKYIKPLLGASSRLGRALAELFGLLVKLCVGSPIRQRRGQNIVAAPPMPSIHAKKVARALNILLAKGLDCDSLPPCPTPKCRLTFLICSVGFTSPMLFDERRYPYYLMLKKFVGMGGQAIFFKTFRWALNGDEVTDVASLPEGTLGFLDAWLTLLEKMVNPKAILESPHVISSRPLNNYHFGPLKYLIQIHRLAFDSILRLWENTPITAYGVRITETVLTILRHIYWGEKIIKEKLKHEESKTELSSSSNGGLSIRDNDTNLRQLMDMGFSRENAIDALGYSTTLEQATDYLLSNPSHSRGSMEIEGEDDQMMQAIAMSLGCGNTGDNLKQSLEELNKLLNDFTDIALATCLKLLNKMPELVHKVCELLVTIMKRNGKAYRNSLLDSVVENIIQNAEPIALSCELQSLTATEYKSMADSENAKRLANYTHLFILFYEVSSYYEMKVPFMAMFGTNLLELIIKLVRVANTMMNKLYKRTLVTVPEPNWLAPCLLLIDTYSKVATRTERKFKMHMSTNRVWRWYDLLTGNWTQYSSTNNKLINEAYWSGEQSVRVTCGRKRYTVTFPNMLQMNDETGNNRPIAMTLLSLSHPSCTNVNKIPLQDPLFADLTAKERARCTPIPPLSKKQIKEIVKACVSLLHLPLERDLLHSILQICVRFTRDFEMAKVFVNTGGIKCLLKMRYINDFGGFGVLATILIRHALEEPTTLTYAMEKVIRGRTLSTIPPPYRDLVYLTRQLGAAVTRDPDTFFEVANNILRIDISVSITKGDGIESLCPLRLEPSVRVKAPPLEDPVSIQVVSDLLDALLKPVDEEYKNKSKNSNADASSASTMNPDAGPSTSVNTDKKKESAKGPSSSEKKDDEMGKKPMFPKSVILKVLADAVVSYGPIARLITEYVYKANCADVIKEDTSALAFILDKILPETENLCDPDCPAMCRMLLASLASANHSPDAQLSLVTEVKTALARALNLPESSEKHSQIQYICSIISTMIDSCPLHHSARWNTTGINNIVKLMFRRGLFNDLAKITHCLDLSSPNTSFTANAALKPLESLSRAINQPCPHSSPNKNRKSQQNNEDTSGAHSGTSTEGTNAQGDEIEDAENTDHDISAVASSLENAVATDSDRLEEMMEHILERGSEDNPSYTDTSRTRHTMEIDDEGPIAYDPERDATEELMSTDSGESDSNPSDQAEDEGNDDNEADDDNMEDNDDNDDTNYEDDDNNETERRPGRESDLLEGTSNLFRLASNDREEDVLMIHYEGDNDTTLPRMIRWNDSGFAIPMLDDNSGDHVIIHPLLLSRSNIESSQNTATRNQRANRARRYQYLFNPRNPNPPVILQRLLGTHDPHTMANMMTANNILSAPTELSREQARVVIMDNLGIIPPNEEQIDFVDQSGYLFGPSLAATLSHVPPVVHWWNMESKLLDLESIFDCTSWICNRLIPNLIKHRYEELNATKKKIFAKQLRVNKETSLIKIDKVRAHNDEDREAVYSSTIDLDSSLLTNGEGEQSGNTPPESQEPQPVREESEIHNVASSIPLIFSGSNVSVDASSRGRGNGNEDGPDILTINGVYIGSSNQDDSDEDIDIDIDPVTLTSGFRMPCNILGDLNTRDDLHEDIDIDIDAIDALASNFSNPLGHAGSREDIDGVPLETSDNSLNDSNDPSESNIQNEMVLSPLQLSLLRSENSNSDSQQSLPDEQTQNASVQTRNVESIDRNDDSNSRADSDVRSENESSNPFGRPRPPRGSVRLVPRHLLTEDIGRQRLISRQFLRDENDTNRPHSLQAIFEEAINQRNQRIEALPAEDQDERQTEGANNDASTSAGTSGDAVSNGGSSQTAAGPSSALDDEEIPEGVDPSFLEALPPEMRREVLEQHRILCLQQRIAQRAAEHSVATEQQEETTTSNEVSPEFLAALPPALQEEVLTQQRLEQQRQAAARAPPNEPVDAQAFFQTLQPSLRTMILSDMEDSQMSALPPDLAAEAQNLRRDWYARNRQMAQQRFLQSNLIIRHTRGGRQTHRPISFPRGAAWSQWSREFMNNPVQNSSQIKIRGRQLLDHEGIACLLILLFTDDPHLNKLRLHRVIRNLCYHNPTREWIINALLAIIDKSVHVKQDENLNKPSRKVPRPGPLISKLLTDAKHLQTGGNWLTIRMEAALGCAANVFLVSKVSGKKADRISGSAIISIHPQAAPIVCKNALDLFTALAKAFPSCLLPIKCVKDDGDKNPITPVKLNSNNQPDFWDVLVKLDSAGTKKGKSIAKTPTSSTAETEAAAFDNTVFGRLLNMLSSPVVNRNTQLTDNLLKLLSVTTSGMPELVKPHRNKKGSTTNQGLDFASNPPTQALNLAVNVITYKNCSEEGLEFITNLLLNLASSSVDMSFMILNLLLNGAVEIGNIVEKQIKYMLNDLKELINTQKRKLEEGGPSTSKGVIYNRFTNEQVVITASAKVKTVCELQLPSMIPLTSKSSSQIFFLRILRVIVQIRNSIKQNMKRNSTENCKLPALSEQLTSLGTLWDTLSECLLELEHAPDHHAVLVLQPAVEAFFLVHSPQQGAITSKDKSVDVGAVGDTQVLVREQVAPADEISDNRGEASTDPPSERSANSIEPAEEANRISFDFEHRQVEIAANRVVTPEQQKFLGFAEKHRTVLNQILRQSTAHLADGPFAVLVDHTRILDFDIKRRYFRTELERIDHGTRREETAVHVRRSNVFEDSFRELFRRTPEEWKNRFYIVFEEEEGQDAGGLLREWYVIISRDIFNPMYALFTVSPGDRVTYMINSASHYNSNHLCYYKFVGRVIAKAIYDNKLLECYFTRSFYKHILGIPVKYTDMESEDYSFYRGLVYLMENNINNLGLDLTFSTEISEFGVTETRDLIPNGRHIPVTEENKMEYVRLVCQMKMTGAIKQQLTAFLEGFYDIIPMRLISIFNEQELELLISGLPNVDIDDLKANTEYHKYQSNSLQIQWFWRALRSFDQADRAKFLQFVTGTSKVPLQGFAALEGMNGVQKFQIHRDDRSTDRLPSAHTCFNQLDLPVYETYDKLRAHLLKAIHECSEGFGFA